MKLAVTSCADPMDQSVQDTWERIAQARPDHLLLLGDQMYMDYAFFPISLFWGNPRNGAPAAYGDVKFAAHMYRRYAAQWRAMQASGLWAPGGPKVHGIWDDHDFAWNNSRGAGRSNEQDPPHKRAVPASKQRIARALFRQFFGHLRAPSYPDNELLTQESIDRLHEDLSLPLFHSDLTALEPGRNVVQLGEGVRLVLTDGRSFRTAQDEEPAQQRTLLGTRQRQWLEQAVGQGGITLIASGCTLDDLTPECWSRFPDYDWLRTLVNGKTGARVLLFSGDVHQTDIRADHGPGLIEVVASGIARPWGTVPWRSSRGNHALCEIKPDFIRLQLFEGESADSRPRRDASIECASWQLLG